MVNPRDPIPPGVVEHEENAYSTAYADGFHDGYAQGKAEGHVQGKREMLATFTTNAKTKRAQMWLTVLAVGGFLTAMLILVLM